MPSFFMLHSKGNYLITAKQMNSTAKQMGYLFYQQTGNHSKGNYEHTHVQGEDT